jgi:hypothetical protein
MPNYLWICHVEVKYFNGNLFELGVLNLVDFLIPHQVMELNYYFNL